MKVDIICDYSLLKERIVQFYPSSKEEISMTKFCHAIKMKTSRLRAIFNGLAYFNKREEFWGRKLLKIDKSQSDDFFCNVTGIIEK